MFKPKPKNTSKIVDGIADEFETPVEKKIKIEKVEKGDIVEEKQMEQQKFETIQNIIEKPYQAKLTINQQYKEEEIPQQVVSKKKGLSIPQRMPASYKFACTFDYNPSLCKDYHDTGYCTFGDSCIYIHDRGDYKAGWEIEKEYQEEQRRKLMRQDIEEDEYQQKLEEYAIPVDCSICLLKLTNPISTKCQHIFCENCIKYKKKCPACQKATNGQFTNAAPIIKDMIDRREKFIQQHQQ